MTWILIGFVSLIAYIDSGFYVAILLFSSLLVFLAWTIPELTIKNPDAAYAMMKVATILSFLIFIFVAWNMQFTGSV